MFGPEFLAGSVMESQEIVKAMQQPESFPQWAIENVSVDIDAVLSLQEKIARAQIEAYLSGADIAQLRGTANQQVDALMSGTTAFVVDYRLKRTSEIPLAVGEDFAVIGASPANVHQAPGHA